jgi:hypothetical protein
MSYIAFNYLGLDSAITGGLFTNVGPAISDLITGLNLGAYSTVADIAAVGFLGFISIMIFPLHWLLTFRPDNSMFAIALLFPWVMTAFITSLLFAKSMKEGFLTPIILGITIIVILIVVFSVIIPYVNNLPQIKSAGIDITGIINGVFSGLAGLPPNTPLANLPAEWIMVLAVGEGSLVGSVFGALAGAIRYNPKSGGYQPKNPKQMSPATTTPTNATTMPTNNYKPF